MRILLSSNHRYPAFDDVSAGRNSAGLTSGSGQHVHDLIVKGLAELGHEVFYLLRGGAGKPLPAGATLVSAPVPDVDIFHCITYRDEDLAGAFASRGKPWVATCHLDLRARRMEQARPAPNWIFVSRSLARSHGSDRYVLNGIDPAETVFSETKDDYFLFMSSLDWASDKGLDIALALSKEAGFKLVVAGASKDAATVGEVVGMCEEFGAEYVGDVRGTRKAELLAGAKAILFPTKVNEAFGLVMAEALMSGTPVICSANGACPEVISAEVGFVCRGWRQYVDAVSRVHAISPRACRDKAMRDYHYRRMAADYVHEYRKEIDSSDA